MKKEEIVFLNQLYKSLWESILRLEKAIEDNDRESVNKEKNFSIDIRTKINKLIENGKNQY